MAEKLLRAGLYVSTKTFLVERNLWVRQGDTVVAGHPLLDGRMKDGTFVPFKPTFEMPAPVAEPEAPASVAAAAAEPESEAASS